MLLVVFPVQLHIFFLQKFICAMLYPNLQLIIFTDCGNWKIFSIKGGENQLHHVNSNIIANNDWWVYTSCLYLVNIVIDRLQLLQSLPCWMTSDKRIIISFIVLVIQHGHQSLCHFNLSGMTANHLLKAFGIFQVFLCSSPCSSE